MRVYLQLVESLLELLGRACAWRPDVVTHRIESTVTLAAGDPASWGGHIELAARPDLLVPVISDVLLAP